MAEEEAVTGRELDEAMDETMRATLKDINSRDPEAEPVAAEPAVVDEVAAPQKDERPRAADGKFIPKESAAPAEKPDKSPAIGAVEQVAADASQPAPEAPAAAQPIDLTRAPSSWKPAAKAAWAALPEPVRAEIYRREGDFHTGLKGIKENADFGQVIKQTVEPYRMLIEAEGGTPERAIADTMRTAALFRVGTPQQKLEALFSIDKQFNAGLQAHFQQAVAAEVAKQTGQPAAQAQPQQPAAFRDERVDQLLANMQKEERARAQREEATSNAATERFLTAKDDKGQPLYPFVSNVLDDMSERVANIRRSNPAVGHEEALKQAYEAAVWANAETRAVLLSQQQATAQQSAETLRKVEQAKRANAGTMPKRGALPAATAVAKFGSPEADEQIRETYRNLVNQ